MIPRLYDDRLEWELDGLGHYRYPHREEDCEFCQELLKIRSAYIRGKKCKIYTDESSYEMAVPMGKERFVLCAYYSDEIYEIVSSYYIKVYATGDIPEYERMKREEHLHVLYNDTIENTMCLCGEYKWNEEN